MSTEYDPEDSHVVVFARRFSFRRLTSTCTVISPVDAPDIKQERDAGYLPILAEVVNINKLYHGTQIASPTIRDSFRKKYARAKSREIEVNVYDLIKPTPLNYQRPKLPTPQQSPSFNRVTREVCSEFVDEFSVHNGGTTRTREFTTESKELRREGAFVFDEDEDYIFKPPQQQDRPSTRHKHNAFTKDSSKDDNVFISGVEEQEEDREKVDPLADFNFETYAKSRRTPPPVTPRVKRRSISSASQTETPGDDIPIEVEPLELKEGTRTTTTSSQTEAEADRIIMSLFNVEEEEYRDEDLDVGTQARENGVPGEDTGTQAGEMFGADASIQVAQVVQHDSETQSLDAVKHGSENQVMATPQRCADTQYGGGEKRKGSNRFNQMITTGTSENGVPGKDTVTQAGEMFGADAGTQASENGVPGEDTGTQAGEMFGADAGTQAGENGVPGEDTGTQAGEMFGADAGTQVAQIVQHDSETQSLDAVKHDSETQVIATPQHCAETQYEGEEKGKGSNSFNQIIKTGTSENGVIREDTGTQVGEMFGADAGTQPSENGVPGEDTGTQAGEMFGADAGNQVAQIDRHDSETQSLDAVKHDSETQVIATPQHCAETQYEGDGKGKRSNSLNQIIKTGTSENGVIGEDTGTQVGEMFGADAGTQASENGVPGEDTGTQVGEMFGADAGTQAGENGVPGENTGTQAGEMFGADAGTQVAQIVQHDSETQSLDAVKHDSETQVMATPQCCAETQYEGEEKGKGSNSFNQIIETGTSAGQTGYPDIVLVPPEETGEPEVKILNNNLNKNLKMDHHKNQPKMKMNLFETTEQYQKQPKLEMNLFDTKAADQQHKKNKLKNLVNSLQAQYGDKMKADKDAALKAATQESTSMIDNLHSQYFSDKSEQGNSGKNSKISEIFKDDKTSKLKNDQLKREFRRTDVKSQVGKMKDKRSDEELLEGLLKEVHKLPTYKAAEFEKQFVKTLTDKEFTELLKHRLKDKGSSEGMTDILKDMVCRIDGDDMYELTEQYLNEKKYGEGSKIAMKVCENFLNKRDISEFIKRNYQYMSTENKKALATNAMEDLPYETMRSVLELQMGRLKEKDIPNVLNSINATPNRKELEKSITILASKLTGEESQKVIKALGKGMKNEEVTKTIKQLFDYLPKISSESLALKYVPKTKVLVEKWTETKAVEVKKMYEKQCGTETIVETTHVQKVIRTEGKSWFSNDKKILTKSTQTEEFSKLLMTKNKNKMDLFTAAQAMMRARKRMEENNMTGRQDGKKKEERKLIKFESMVETDGGQVVVKRAELNEKIKILEDEKDRIFNEYSWTAQLLQEAEDELQDYKDSFERKEIALEEAKREAEYNMNDLNIARQEIDVLENELADVRAALFNERQRKSNINKKGNFNVDRLHRELEKLQDQEQELSLIQEDFLDMERKWLQEQKHREYYEESSSKAESKAKELSTQLYMLITNELTPAALKEQMKRDNPAETKDIPHLSPGQLSALLTLFVAGGVLPTTKVPDTATIFTKDELHKGSSLTPDTALRIITNEARKSEGTSPTTPERTPNADNADLLGAKKGPDAPPAPTAPKAPNAPKAPPPPKGAPPAPPPPNAPPLVPGAPAAPPPPNAPSIKGAPPAPRPPNAPPPPGASGALAPKVGLVVDERLLTAEKLPEKAPDGPATYVPRGRLEDLKSRRRDRGKKANLPKKKIIPEPSRQLKVFNWTKLPEAKAANSIWKDMDESQILRMLDLDEIDDLFQAKKIVKKDLEEGGQKKKNISVIDPKKAQNCTILLSKIKKSNEELVDLIITCDKGDLLHVDMLEMLMKYTPTAEEKDSLNQVAEDEDVVAALARADRFMLDVSKIYHYDERLKSLYFRRKFEERFNFIRPKIRCLVNASNEVYKSHKLRELLQLLLGFGNYFNYGKRGNAMGFKLETLTKLIDTKATSDNKFTLMHYVAETIESQFPDIHDFMDDVLHVPLAAKVGLGDLKMDVNDFQSSFRALVKECDHMSKNPQIKGARHFANMFDVFIKEAEPKMQEIEADMGEMKKKYLIATQHFAEPSSIEPEAFFGNFNTFFMHYKDAKEDLERKREEEELKKARDEKQKIKLSESLSVPNSSLSPSSPGRLSPCQSPKLGERRIELTDVEKLEVQDHDMMLGMLGVRGGSPKPQAEDGDLFDGTLSQISAGSTGRRRKKRATTISHQRERSSYDTL